MTQTEKSPGRGRKMGGFYNYEIKQKINRYGIGIRDGIIHGCMQQQLQRTGVLGSCRRQHDHNHGRSGR